MLSSFNYIVSFDYTLIVNIFISVLCGVSIRFALSFTNQNWVNTYQHTLAYALLPAITFVITKVISGNVALSLGMIGALSIVRFRNPVKNPIELVIYFALITIGISSSVKIIFGVALTIIIIAILILTNYSYFFMQKRGKILPAVNFGDGNTYNTIEITCNESNEKLKNNKFLVNFVENFQEKIFIYRLASKNYDDAKQELDEIKKNEKGIISVSANRTN